MTLTTKTVIFIILSGESDLVILVIILYFPIRNKYVTEQLSLVTDSLKCNKLFIKLSSPSRLVLI